MPAKVARTTDAPLVAVYADESCLGNGREGDNPGGAGGLIEIIRGDALVRRDYWISENATTNNRMALRSVIEGFHALSKKGNRFRVVFTTDSRYLVDGMTDWVHRWAALGWRRKSGPLENKELWLEAVDAVERHEVRWRWVRGHAGHPQNEYANELATRAARELSSSHGAVESRFDLWLGEQRAAGRMAIEPDPLPTRFAPHRPLPR
ncbi:MAG: ribonuclease H family protein [Gemmatimonadaceae bacterium]